MNRFVIVASLVALVSSAPSREKRQAGCLSSFQNVPNVCANNPSGTVFFPHPTDPTKFLQCDLLKRMYIIQCPNGNVFDMVLGGCDVPQPATSFPVVTSAPVTSAPATYAPPVTMKPYQPPVTQTPWVPQTVQPNTSGNQGSNPCTPQNIARGQIYFAIQGDKTQYIECDLQGNAKKMDCPQVLEWDQNILSCVYPMNLVQNPNNNQNPNQPKPTPNIPSGQNNNPCTKSALSAGNLYFPAANKNQFIQCDLWGDAFTMNCPSKMYWHAMLLTCYRPYVQMGPAASI